MNAYRDPPLYTVEDLMGEPEKTQYYAQQLRPAPDPNESDFTFEIEDVIRKKKLKGEDYIFVKYLYYPRKYIDFLMNTFYNETARFEQRTSRTNFPVTCA